MVNGELYIYPWYLQTFLGVYGSPGVIMKVSIPSKKVGLCKNKKKIEFF